MSNSSPATHHAPGHGSPALQMPLRVPMVEIRVSQACTGAGRAVLRGRPLFRGAGGHGYDPSAHSKPLTGPFAVPGLPVPGRNNPCLGPGVFNPGPNSESTLRNASTSRLHFLSPSNAHRLACPSAARAQFALVWPTSFSSKPCSFLHWAQPGCHLSCCISIASCDGTGHNGETNGKSNGAPIAPTTVQLVRRVGATYHCRALASFLFRAPDLEPAIGPTPRLWVLLCTQSPTVIEVCLNASPPLLPAVDSRQNRAWREILLLRSIAWYRTTSVPCVAPRHPRA
jgi:hypothetical protein